MQNWKLVHFSDILTEPVRNGIYKSKQYHGYGIKIINMGELFSYNRLSDINMKRITLTELEKNKYILKNGDLIFARRSLTAEGAGKCSLIYNIVEDTVFESSIIRARPDKNKCSSETATTDDKNAETVVEEKVEPVKVDKSALPAPKMSIGGVPAETKKSRNCAEDRPFLPLI